MPYIHGMCSVYMEYILSIYMGSFTPYKKAYKKHNIIKKNILYKKHYKKTLYKKKHKKACFYMP